MAAVCCEGAVVVQGTKFRRRRKDPKSTIDTSCIEERAVLKSERLACLSSVRIWRVCFLAQPILTVRKGLRITPGLGCHLGSLS